MLKRVAANTAWNIFGQLPQLLAALAAFPLLIGQIGLERFGFVSIAWVLVGYTSMFDFGVSKALKLSPTYFPPKCWSKCLICRAVTAKDR